MPLILSTALFILGAMLGAAANFLIYRQRIEPRAISPWMVADLRANKRQWFDYVPIFGWLSLRRNAPLFGAGFWIRPLLVELLMGLGVSALYQFEIQGGLLPAGIPRLLLLNPRTVFLLHWEFVAHVVLIFWMTVAALIDADESIIPDSITMPGTILGLILAAFCPWSLLPDVFPNAAGLPDIHFLHLSSPIDWPVGLGPPRFAGLLIGLGCWLLWCVALLPRTWYSRHGWRRAIGLCGARICRERFSLLTLFLAIFGALAVGVGWHHGGNHWAGLLSALVGMAAGGGVVWAVRIIGSAALGREAMGFGDVTLLAMIGAFLGWQASLVVFFLAPFAAIVVGVFRLIFSRQSEIPYGPFLCLAALATIIYWEAIWDRTWAIFSLGWIVPLMLAACFALMPLLLVGWRMIKERLWR